MQSGDPPENRAVQRIQGAFVGFLIIDMHLFLKRRILQVATSIAV